MPSQERVAAFENWLRRLDDAPNLAAATPAQALQSFWNAFSPVTPHIPLPPPPFGLGRACGNRVCTSSWPTWPTASGTENCVSY
jgi:hypothetical protein